MRPEKVVCDMTKTRALLLALTLAVGAALAVQWPEIRRYIRMERM
jgi:hypothetical protein